LEGVCVNHYTTGAQILEVPLRGCLRFMSRILYATLADRPIEYLVPRITEERSPSKTPHMATQQCFRPSPSSMALASTSFPCLRHSATQRRFRNAVKTQASSAPELNCRDVVSVAKKVNVQGNVLVRFLGADDTEVQVVCPLVRPPDWAICTKIICTA
jgi:hypothetical protein